LDDVSPAFLRALVSAITGNTPGNGELTMGDA
jgi:hypothetical protein